MEQYKGYEIGEFEVVDWNIENITGYKPLTTFYTDFSIADKFGMKAINDTYKRAFKGWKSHYKYVTELSMVLNWKCWEHYYAGHEEVSARYSDLYYTVREWCLYNLKGEELTYYLKTTD